LFRQRDGGAREPRHLSLSVGPGTGGHTRELRSRSRQARPARLLAVRVQGQVVRSPVTGKRHVDAFPPTVGRLPRTQQDAGIGIPRKSELRVKLYVLVALVQYEPPAILRLGCTCNPPVFRAPIRVSKCMPTGQRRSPEGKVRDEIVGGGENGRQ
jgi:hypothetical protein